MIWPELARVHGVYVARRETREKVRASAGGAWRLAVSSPREPRGLKKLICDGPTWNLGKAAASSRARAGIKPNPQNHAAVH